MTELIKKANPFPPRLKTAILRYTYSKELMNDSRIPQSPIHGGEPGVLVGLHDPLTGEMEVLCKAKNVVVVIKE